jgi:excisionase family DNA binding protein
MVTKLLTMDEAASALGYTRRTLENYISVGRGPAVTIVGTRGRRITEEDLESWIRALPKIEPPGKAA